MELIWKFNGRTVLVLGGKRLSTLLLLLLLVVMPPTLSLAAAPIATVAAAVEPCAAAAAAVGLVVTICTVLPSCSTSRTLPLVAWFSSAVGGTSRRPQTSSYMPRATAASEIVAVEVEAEAAVLV